MNWNNIISAERTGKEAQPDSRTGYQIDFDRLIFSSAFRRLQNKTQVFPLPGSTFVHNRLTHSLEVASVGRSLGKITGAVLAERNVTDQINKEFYRYELQNVIASACLAHDIGNPSFGHAGEDAISNYFLNNRSFLVDNTHLQDFYTLPQWKDLTNFEGNANSFRILTHKFNGKATGGYRLTYTTLAAIMKYPCESIAMDKKEKNTSKYSFFQSEKSLANTMLEKLNIQSVSASPMVFKRHPFVYLTEAADDICYLIVDFEDAQRLHLLAHQDVLDLFKTLIGRLDKNSINKVNSELKKIGDKNEQIAYLRAKSINVLTKKASDLFLDEADAIMDGKFNMGLIDYLSAEYDVLQVIKKRSKEEIYNHESVVQLELAGYKVMSDLLAMFIPAVLTLNPNMKEKKIISLLPEQFKTNASESYEKTFSVLDYLSGMTDSFAIDLYRKLFGIEIPKHI